jgi:N-acetylneuraminic acid mutarotase
MDYLRDVASYNPAANRWRRVTSMPRGTVGGAAIALDGGGLLMLGGSDGHDFHRMRELGEDYRLPNDVLRYDAASDRWTVAGTMPLGLTAAAVIKTDSGWIIASGEYAIGYRTPRVHQLKIDER